MTTTTANNSQTLIFHTLLPIGLALSLLTGSSAAADPVKVTIAEDGQARHAVVVSSEATERTRAAAGELAQYLQRISGARFEVQTGDGLTGLAVGVVGDFPALELGVRFEADEPFRRDDYLLRTHAKGVYLIGAGELATHLAVWDFLHRLGYRLYFLTDAWEIVPERSLLEVALDTYEQPDYVTRAAPRGASWSHSELWNRWRLRNRVDSSFSLSTGHIYGQIVRDNQDAFNAHPEYYALVDGERKPTGADTKFCISNEGLRQMVVDWAVREMKRDPERDSISMDPSDGGSWCECEECAAMGSASDLALTLANEVAEAINKLGLGSKYVGIYAYNQHSPPPNIPVHPKVVVSVATSFIRGGYTIEELVEGWQAKDATLGIRDYHDVFTWSHDGPRRARGGNVDYLRRTIPYYHEQGARFMNSENSDSWGANGLGYWMTPRMLWDVEEADQVEELFEDFLDRAFGSAKEPMCEFYQLLNFDYDSVHSNEDVVARMYRHLEKARQLADDSAIHKRLEDLILYTRYLELYYAYRQANGAARQAAFELVWRHAYRIRDRMMLSTVAICDRGRNYRDSSVAVPAEADWNVPEEGNPWKTSKPFEAEEIAELLQAGIEANETTVLDFEPTAYSQYLVPAAPLNLPEVEPGRYQNWFRGPQTIYTWVPEGQRRIELKVTGGLIPHYRDRGNVQIALHAEQEATLEPVARDESVVPDGEPRTVVLRTPYNGLHTLQWSDGHDMTRVVWPEGLPFTVRSTLEEPMHFQGSWSLYFYVPHGTQTVGGYSTGTRGHLLDGGGKTRFSFSDLEEAGYFSVPVPDGQDGTLWKFENCDGQRMLMSVPPYLAPTAENLLLPREVVQADANE